PNNILAAIYKHRIAAGIINQITAAVCLLAFHANSPSKYLSAGHGDKRAAAAAVSLSQISIIVIHLRRCPWMGVNIPNVGGIGYVINWKQVRVAPGCARA